MANRKKSLRSFIEFMDTCGYDEHPAVGHINIDSWAGVLEKWIKEMGYRKVKEVELEKCSIDSENDTLGYFDDNGKLTYLEDGNTVLIEEE